MCVCICIFPTYLSPVQKLPKKIRQHSQENGINPLLTLSFVWFPHTCKRTFRSEKKKKNCVDGLLLLLLLSHFGHY